MSCCATGALAACAAYGVGPGVLAFFVLFGYTAGGLARCARPGRVSCGTCDVGEFGMKARIIRTDTRGSRSLIYIWPL